MKIKQKYMYTDTELALLMFDTNFHRNVTYHCKHFLYAVIIVVVLITNKSIMLRKFDLRLRNNDMVLCKETLNVFRDEPVKYGNVIMFVVRSRYIVFLNEQNTS